MAPDFADHGPERPAARPFRRRPQDARRVARPDRHQLLRSQAESREAEPGEPAGLPVDEILPRPEDGAGARGPQREAEREPCSRRGVCLGGGEDLMHEPAAERFAARKLGKLGAERKRRDRGGTAPALQTPQSLPQR